MKSCRGSDPCASIARAILGQFDGARITLREPHRFEINSCEQAALEA